MFNETVSAAARLTLCFQIRFFSVLVWFCARAEAYLVMMQGVTENEKFQVFNKKRVKSDSVTTGHDGQSAKGRKRKKKRHILRVTHRSPSRTCSGDEGLSFRKMTSPENLLSWCCIQVMQGKLETQTPRFYFAAEISFLVISDFYAQAARIVNITRPRESSIQTFT